MGLTGRKTVEIKIKSCGDAFHELFGRKPHETCNHTPDLVQGCHLHHGEWGADGSVISWTYFHDGKLQVAKQIVHINEEEKSITWELIGGDVKEFYKSFSDTVKVDKKGDYTLVTWILEYEKIHEDAPDLADSLLDYFAKLTKAVEESHLKKINT